MTSSESRKKTNGEWLASRITDAIKIGLSMLPSLDPFQGIVNIQGNTEKPVNLSDLYCMVLESECIANDFDDEEDDDEFWQKDNGGERGAFYAFQNFMDDE